MNSLYDFRKQLTDSAYKAEKPFRKAMNWNTWAKADGKIQIPRFMFFRNAETEIRRML